MTHSWRIFLFLSLALLQSAVSAQPTELVHSTVPTLSEKFADALSRALEKDTIGVSRRTAAFADFMKAQRQLWSASRQRTMVESVELRNAGKTSLIAALEKDPRLSEAYTMLAELELTSQSQNVSEALALAELATRANPANFGGHRLRSRILTRLAGITDESFDRNAGTKAIAAWKQTAKLDPMNAEAWAFLSRLYEVTNEPDLQIEALQKWTGASVSLDAGFYRAVMGPEAELTPEAASMGLAAVLIKRDRAEEAIEILTRILIDDPKNRKAAKLAADTIDSKPTPALDRIARKLRTALSSNPGNEALILLVAKISSSRM